MIINKTQGQMTIHLKKRRNDMAKGDLKQQVILRFLLEYAEEKTKIKLDIAEKFIWQEAYKYLKGATKRLDHHNKYAKESMRKRRII